MNKICTDVEQSQKLIELGIDRKTSDMFYSRADVALGEMESYPNILHREEIGDDIPAWSLSALLDILVEQDFTIKAIGNNFNIDIPIRHCRIWFPSLLDAAFEMVCWLKENKKI